MRHATRTVSLGVVLACAIGTMVVGAALKAPCADGQGWNGKQYRLLCYTDIVPLAATEQLTADAGRSFPPGRLPFIDACAPSQNNCDEYPVLTMYFMRVAGWISLPGGGAGVSGAAYAAFFSTNAILLTACAVAIAVCLWTLAGRRALWFALAPTLLVYGTVNWDLFAVALATGALVAFAARRDRWAGVLLGLGAAAKFFPGMLVVPLLFQGLADREPDRSIRVAWWSVGTWVAVNLPFAIAAPSGWWEFFRFNSKRPADFDSLWYIGCRYTKCDLTTAKINAASAISFVVLVALLWAWKRHRDPGFQRWTLGFPILVAFLLTNKVYSPQYGLWLLPWFALALPRFNRFAAFEVTDVLVFVTRFWFFGTYVGAMALPQQWWFETAVLVRSAVLVWCLITWVRIETPPLTIAERGPSPVPVAPVAA